MSAFNKHDFNRVKKAIREAQCRLNECEDPLLRTAQAFSNIQEQHEELAREQAREAADASMEDLFDKAEEARNTLQTVLDIYDH